MWRGVVIICLVALVAIDGLPNHEIDNARYDSSFQANGRRHQKASVHDEEQTRSLDVDRDRVVHTLAGSQRERNSEGESAFDVNQSVKEEISNDGGVLKHSKLVSESHDESQSYQDSAASRQSSYYAQASSNVGDGHPAPINHGHVRYNPSIPAQPVAPIFRPLPIRHSSLTHLPNQHHHDGNLRNGNEFYHDNHGHFGHSNDGNGNYGHNGWYGNGYVNHNPNGWFRRYIPQSGVHPHRHFGYQPVPGYQGVGSDHYNRFHNYEIGNPSLDARNKVKYVPSNGNYEANSGHTKPGLNEVLNALGYNPKKDKHDVPDKISHGMAPETNADNDGTKVNFANGNDETKDTTAKDIPIAGNIPELGTPEHPVGGLDHVLSAMDYARGPKKPVNYEAETIQYVPAIVPEYINRPVNYDAIGIEVPDSGILIPDESEEYVPNMYGISPVRYIPVAENIPEYMIPKQRIRYYENPVPYVGSPVVIPEETAFTNDRFVPKPTGFNGFVKPYKGEFQPEPSFIPEVSYSPTFDNNPNKKTPDVIEDTVIEKDGRSINDDDIVIDRTFITKVNTENSQETNKSSKQNTTTVINKAGKKQVGVTPLDNDDNDDILVKKTPVVPVPVQKSSEPNNNVDKETKTPIPVDKGVKIKKPPVSRRIPIPKNPYPPRNVIHKKIDAVPLVIDKFSDVPEKPSADKTVEKSENDVINQNSDLPYAVERKPVIDDAKPKTDDTNEPSDLVKPTPLNKGIPEKKKAHIIRTPSGVILHAHFIPIDEDLSPIPETKEIKDGNKDKIVTKKPPTKPYISTPKKDKDVDQNVHGYNPVQEERDATTVKDEKVNPTTQKPISQIRKPIPRIPRIPKVPGGYIDKTKQPQKLDDNEKPIEDINQKPKATPKPKEPATSIAPKTTTKKEDDVPDKIIKKTTPKKYSDSQNDSQDNDEDDEYYKIIKSYRTVNEEEETSSSQNSRTETRMKRVLRHKNRKPGDKDDLSDDDDTIDENYDESNKPVNHEQTTTKPRKKFPFKVVGESNDDSEDSDDEDDYLENDKKSPSTLKPDEKQPIKPVTENNKNNKTPNVLDNSTDKNIDRNTVTTEKSIGLTTTKKPDVTEKPSVKTVDQKPIKGINTPNEKKTEDTTPKPDSKEIKDGNIPSIIRKKPIKVLKPKTDKDLDDDDDKEFVSRTVIEDSEDSTFNNKQHRSVTETEKIIRRGQKKPVKKPNKPIPDSIDDEEPDSKTDKTPTAKDTDSNNKPVTEKPATEKKPDSGNNEELTVNKTPRNDKKRDTKNPQENKQPNKPATGITEKPVTTENSETNDKKPKNGSETENKPESKTDTTEKPTTGVNKDKKPSTNAPDTEQTPNIEKDNKPDTSTKTPEPVNTGNKKPIIKEERSIRKGPIPIFKVDKPGRKVPTPIVKGDNKPIRRIPIRPDNIKLPVSRSIDDEQSFEECDSMEDSEDEEHHKSDGKETTDKTKKPVPHDKGDEKAPDSKHVNPKTNSSATTEKNDVTNKTPLTESSKVPNTTETPKDKQLDTSKNGKPDTSNSDKDKKTNTHNNKNPTEDDNKDNNPKTTSEKQPNSPAVTETTPAMVTTEKTVNIEKPKPVKDCDYFGDVDCEDYDDDDNDDSKVAANTTENPETVIEIEKDIIVDENDVDSSESDDVTEESEETVSDEDFSSEESYRDVQDDSKKQTEEKPDGENTGENNPNDKPTTTTVKPDAVSTEKNKKPNENKDKPIENQKPIDNIKKSIGNNDKPSDNGKKPNENRETPAENTENNDKPSDDSKKPTDSTETPTENQKLDEDNPKPSENNDKLSDSSKKPTDSTGKPNGNKKPNTNNKKPSENDDNPSDISKKPTDNTKKPSGNQKPDEDNPKPSKNNNTPSDSGNKPTDSTGKPNGNRKPTEDNTKPSENNDKPNDSSKKPNENSGKPTDSTDKPTENKSSEKKLDEGNQKPIYNTEKPNVNITDKLSAEIPDDESLEDQKSPDDDIDSEHIVEIEDESFEEDSVETDSESVATSTEKKPNGKTDKPKSNDCDYFGDVDCEDFNDDDTENVTDKNTEQDDTTKPNDTEQNPKPNTTDKDSNVPVNQQLGSKKPIDNKKPDVSDDGKDDTDLNEKPSTKPGDDSDDKKQEDNKVTEKPKSDKKPDIQVVDDKKQPKSETPDSIFNPGFYKDTTEKSKADTENKEPDTNNADKKPKADMDESNDKTPEEKAKGTDKPDTKPNTDIENSPKPKSNDQDKKDTTEKPEKVTDETPDNKTTEKQPVNENTVPKPDTKTTDNDGNKENTPNTKDSDKDKTPGNKEKKPLEQNPDEDVDAADKTPETTTTNGNKDNKPKPGKENTKPNSQTQNDQNTDKIPDIQPKNGDKKPVSDNAPNDKKPIEDRKPNSVITDKRPDNNDTDKKTPDTKPKANEKTSDSITTGNDKTPDKNNDDINKKPADKPNNNNEKPDSKGTVKPDGKSTETDKNPATKKPDSKTDKSTDQKPADKQITKTTTPDQPKDSKTPDNDKNKKPKDTETVDDEKPSTDSDKPIVDDKDSTDKTKAEKDKTIDTNAQDTDLTIQRKVVNSMDEVLKYKNREGFTFKACDETENSNESSTTNKNKQVKLTKFIRTKKNLNKTPKLDDKDDTERRETDKRPTKIPIYRSKLAKIIIRILTRSKKDKTPLNNENNVTGNDPKNTETNPNPDKTQQIWLTEGNRIIFRRNVEYIRERELGCFEELFRSDRTVDDEVIASTDDDDGNDEARDIEGSVDKAPLEDIPDDDETDGIIPLEEGLTTNDQSSNNDAGSDDSESNSEGNDESSVA